MKTKYSTDSKSQRILLLRWEVEPPYKPVTFLEKQSVAPVLLLLQFIGLTVAGFSELDQGAYMNSGGGTGTA